MKNRYVADTMAFILRLEKRKLPEQVKQIFLAAETDHAEIFIPAMVLAEIAYLSEKGRIDINLSQVKQYLLNYPSVQEKEINLEIIEAAFNITDIPELHDRIISGCAKACGVELLTNDPVIHASAFIEALW